MPLTPPWLYYLLGVLMLVVAGYSLVLLVLSAASRRTAGADVELSHVVMGVAMAGMFVARWSFGPSAFWEASFGVLLIWFLARGTQSVQRYGPHLPHTWVHALMSVTMLLMYWFPMGSAGATSAGMAMSAREGRVDPALSFLLAFALFASAIFTLASPNKGGAVYGTHVLTPATEGAESTSEPAYLANTPSSAGGIEGVLAAPRVVDATHVLMCLAMGFMLVLAL